MSNPFQPYYHTPTDDTLRETIPHGDDGYPLAYYSENIWQFDFHCIDWHWHHELEFLSVADGTITCLVGEDRFELTQGCGLFINSGILHRMEAADNCTIPNIVFSPTLLSPKGSIIYEKYVSPLLQYAPSYQILDPRIPWQQEILQLLTVIFHWQEQADIHELQTLEALLKLWAILGEHLPISREKADTSHSLRTHRQARLQIMMQYIHEHHTEQIILDEIAGAAAISKSSALQLFQSGIHCSPVAYLNQYRLTHAAKLLGTTEKTVSAIAEETGFASAGYFCRKFKDRYQITPNQYRNKQKQSHSISLDKVVKYE